MRGRLLDIVRAVLAVAVLAAVAIALWRNWDAVSTELALLPSGAIVTSFLLALSAPVLTLFGWRVLLRDLGTDLALPPSASIFFVGQLGKYVPGSVWSVVAQAEMGQRLGIPRRRMGVTSLLAIGLSVVWGALLGLPALPLLLDRSGGAVSAWWLVAAVIAAGVVLTPRILGAVVDGLLRLLRRDPLGYSLTGRAVVVTSCWFALAWLAVGASVLVMARALSADADPTDLALACLSGFPLAGAIGMFSFFLPAGVGVRDGVLAVLLAGLMSPPAAAAVVVVARFLSIVVDIVLALLGWIWGRTHHLLGTPSGATGER